MDTFDALILPLEIERHLAEVEAVRQVAGLCEEMRILQLHIADCSASIRRLLDTIEGCE